MATKTNIDTSRRSRGAGATMHVAELAERARVSPTTVRYYARIGLLSPDRNDQNGYRTFDREDLRRLIFIRKAQSLGLTIADIRSLLDRIERGRPVCDRVVALVRNRLDEIAQRRRELVAAQERIEQTLARWSDRPRRRSEFCPLIDQVELIEDPPESSVPACVQSRGGAEQSRQDQGMAGREAMRPRSKKIVSSVARTTV